MLSDHVRNWTTHILLAFLGCALWVTLKHLLQRKQTPLTPARPLALLAAVQSAEIVLPTTDGREIRLRRITTPSPEQRAALGLLGLTLPEHLNLNFECSVNSSAV
jgi:ABC-type siderophore export system fused ATPase/permease subunit